jgi:hypothetical protein
MKAAPLIEALEIVRGRIVELTCDEDTTDEAFELAQRVEAQLWVRCEDEGAGVIPALLDTVEVVWSSCPTVGHDDVADAGAKTGDGCNCLMPYWCRHPERHRLGYKGGAK